MKCFFYIRNGGKNITQLEALNVAYEELSIMIPYND